MQPNETLDLNEPKTLTLSPQSIAAILDALAEKPYRISNGPINEIISQLRSAAGQQHGSTTDGIRSSNGISGEGNVKANGHDGGNRDPAS